MKLSDLKLKKLEDLIEELSDMDDPLFGNLMGKGEEENEEASEEEVSEEGSEEEKLLKKKKPMSIKILSVDSLKKPKGA